MAEEAATEEPKKKKGKIKIIIPVVVLVLGLGGGGFFLTSGKKAAATAGAATTTTTLMPGPVIVLDPITTNLSDGHILKVGLSLRLSSKPKDKTLATVVAGAAAAEAATTPSASPMDGEESIALDLAIQVLGDDTYSSLSTPDGRAAAKADLTKQIEAAYTQPADPKAKPGTPAPTSDVTDVYFNTFVMS